MSVRQFYGYDKLFLFKGLCFLIVTPDLNRGLVLVMTNLP